MNNTALLYQKGSAGINVEPNPDLFELFRKYRKRDININAGVSTEKGLGKYYSMDVPSLNTFSEMHVNDYLKEGHSIRSTIDLRLLRLADISNDYYHGRWPDLLTIDVEGLDFDILRSLDYSNKPVVICVETISYSTTGHGKKDTALIQFMNENGYFLYADTYINSIFVKRDCWYR
ncbi:MAG: FkbM family methyltransferase [Bacteroidota bacterium]